MNANREGEGTDRRGQPVVEARHGPNRQRRSARATRRSCQASVPSAWRCRSRSPGSASQAPSSAVFSRSSAGPRGRVDQRAARPGVELGEDRAVDAPRQRAAALVALLLRPACVVVAQAGVERAGQGEAVIQPGHEALTLGVDQQAEPGPEGARCAEVEASVEPDVVRRAGRSVPEEGCLEPAVPEPDVPVRRPRPERAGVDLTEHESRLEIHVGEDRERPGVVMQVERRADDDPFEAAVTGDGVGPRRRLERPAAAAQTQAAAEPGRAARGVRRKGVRRGHEAAVELAAVVEALARCRKTKRRAIHRAAREAVVRAQRARRAPRTRASSTRVRAAGPRRGGGCRG
jgi:hypothetical protein